MAWYHYFSGFWAGMFLANFIPHFIKGVAGDPFPTPFSNPPGKGLSSPVINVLWALFNLVAAYSLFRLAKISMENGLSIIFLFAGFSLLSIWMSTIFVHKHKA